MIAGEDIRELCRRLTAGSADHGDDATLTLHRAIEIARLMAPLASDADVAAMAAAAVAHLHGLGPLQRFLADPAVDEIMVNNGGDVWVERGGQLAHAGRLGADVTPRLIERILDPLGRRLDRLSPVVDARLPDGSRVCAVIPPIAVDGACLTLRRFAVRRRALAEFTSPAVVALLHEIIDRRCNVLISGATSSGKTSLLNVLMSRVSPNERIITLEDTAELRLDATHVLRLETRPRTVDGTPAITLADLVRTSLRLRPDRLVIGEIRGDEVVDMLQALNTGHDGSFTTCHANGPDDAVRRVQSLVVQHTNGWPLDAVHEHVHSSLDIVIHVVRSAEGARRVSEVIELARPGTDGADRRLASGTDVLATLARGRR
ncbi:MAG: ATPase, T2SS/T4P/T4SS family [Ilumatobacteraceae bacterium]